MAQYLGGAGRKVSFPLRSVVGEPKNDGLRAARQIHLAGYEQLNCLGIYMKSKRILFFVALIALVKVVLLTLPSCSLSFECNQIEALEKDVGSIESTDSAANKKIPFFVGFVAVPAHYEKAELAGGKTMFRRVVSGEQPSCGPSLSEIVVYESGCKECDRDAMVLFGTLVSEEQFNLDAGAVELLLWRQSLRPDSGIDPLYVQVIHSKSNQHAVIVLDTRLEFVEAVKTEFVRSLNARKVD